MNKYYDKYLKYKKKYLNLQSQLAGSYNSPTRAGLFNSPTRAGLFNSPTRAGLFNSPTRAGSFNSPTRAGSFNSPTRAGSFNSPTRAGSFNSPTRAGSFNSPPAGSFNSPPAGSFNSPPAGSFNSPPAGSFNSPPAGSFNSPPAGSFNSPPASLNLSTPPASPNLRDQNTIKPDLRSKDEINNEIIQLVNISFGNTWLLTGSLAIIKYQKALGISSDLVANDVDILKICEGHHKLWNIKKKIIGRYIRVQQTPEKSVTFKNGNNSFDVTCISELLTHNIIDGIRVLSPKILLDDYKFNNRDQDIEKINMLKKIIEIIEQDYTKFIL
jgi:hypothetical protein